LNIEHGALSVDDVLRMNLQTQDQDNEGENEDADAETDTSIADVQIQDSHPIIPGNAPANARLVTGASSSINTAAPLSIDTDEFDANLTILRCRSK